MRKIYKKKIDEELYLVEVDLDTQEFEKDFSYLFSVFIKATLNELKEIKESLVLGIEYDKKAKYIGSREIDGWSELYFCASYSKDLNSMVTTMLQDKNLIYESNIVKDRRWSFYKRQLLPTPLEFANIQSSNIINLLKEEGDILENVREVEHYLSFEIPTQKEKFIENLAIDGFVYKDEIDTQEFENGIVLMKKHSVDESSVEIEVTNIFEALKEFGGYYEGWSTVISLEEE